MILYYYSWIEYKAAPMFQFALPVVLFRFRVRGPAIRPLLQLPNRRETAPERTSPVPPLYIMFYGGIVLRTPPHPLSGYADRWKEKNGSANVPVRITSGDVQSPRARTRTQTIVAIAEQEGDRRYCLINNNSITASKLCASFEWHFWN